ncbi:hypothetical protein HPB52_022803 [Rhipicephalus sanguineus]|uniref:Uncharacterized protein n=1 Tax=Rhipicephalus sanguineus TaxID=34632 RepID=A0A9D4T820_RHISA|nr:hypothetical protein HPB52_022803 [Rhipicephalus sanguineus]
MASCALALVTENSSARPSPSREQPTEERMDYSDIQTRPKTATTGNAGADTDYERRTQTTTHVSVGQRRGLHYGAHSPPKKQQARERRQAPRNDPLKSNAERPNFHRRSRKFRKLPPLPRDDLKEIIRPHQGLPIRVLTSATLADALI